MGDGSRAINQIKFFNNYSLGVLEKDVNEFLSDENIVNASVSFNPASDSALALVYTKVRSEWRENKYYSRPNFRISIKIFNKGSVDYAVFERDINKFLDDPHRYFDEIQYHPSNSNIVVVLYHTLLDKERDNK